MSETAQMASREEFEADRDAQRNWLRNVLKETCWSGTHLASESGVAQTTINRFLNNPDVKHLLSTTTITRIVRATGIAAPPEMLSRAPTMTDPDLMLIALREARAFSESEDDVIEARLIAEFYDAVAEAVIDGRSTGDAAKTLRSNIRRRLRERSAPEGRRTRNTR